MSGKRKKGNDLTDDGDDSVEQLLGKIFEGVSARQATKQGADTPVAIKLKARIEQTGPLTLHDYMATCLGDPEFGYYITHQPFGTKGDFITAPDVCQIFGELLGLWCVHVWEELGQPGKCKLIELGPGRGALMSDALRAASLVPKFLQSIEVHFVETSKALRAQQEQLIKAQAKEHGRQLPQLFWHDELSDIPPGPSFLLANEFLDALPIRQYQFKHGAWYERLVGLDETGAFTYMLADQPGNDPDGLSLMPNAPVDGDLLETRPATKRLLKQIAKRASAHPFNGLLIDYGYNIRAFGDSFQAIKNHQFADPLRDQGFADLTAHVDFSSLVQTIIGLDLKVAGPVTQRDFLIALGARERAAQLMQAQENMIDAQQFMTGLQRLIEPDQMGSLFKVVGLYGAGQVKGPGFEPPLSGNG